MPSLSLAELAGLIQGTVSESPGPLIHGVRPIEFATVDDITYITGPQVLDKLSRSAAGAVIIPYDLDYGELPHIKAKSPEVAFAILTEVFHAPPRPTAEISSKADISSDCRIGANVSIGSFSVLEAGVNIADDVCIGHNVVIGADSSIGRGSRIYSNVTIYPGAKIGENVTIHSGCVIGADGFGYAHEIDANGSPRLYKKYHSGSVVIGNNVELGAMVAVDRALAGYTTIESNVKIDNLVQVAHNVEIGSGTVIASQSGIAGSSKIGKSCLLGGQVGIRDHVTIGDGVMLATRVGIYRDVASGSILAGSMPPMPHKVFLRVQTLVKRLPELLDRIRKLEGLLNNKSKETL